MILDREQRMEEARSWSNFWTGLAVSTVAISTLPTVFAINGMGLDDVLGLGAQDYAQMAGALFIGILLGRVFQTQAILTLRKAARP